jgi:hypothetical protein
VLDKKLEIKARGGEKWAGRFSFFGIKEVPKKALNNCFFLVGTSREK